MNANLKKVAMVVALMAAVPTANAGDFADLIEAACGGCGVGEELERQLEGPLDLAPKDLRGVPLSPYCVTPKGIGTGPWAPRGTPCNVNDESGIIGGALNAIT